MISKDIRQRWDRLALTYGEIEREEALLPVLSRFPPSDRSLVLDVGCGAGRDMATLAETAAKVIGVDVSHQMARLALQFGPAVTADNCSLPFPDGVFDYVWTRVVLPYIPNWQTALAEDWRMLKHGGILVLILSNTWSFMSPFRFILSEFGWYSEGRMRHFRKQDIFATELLQNAVLLDCFAVEKKARSSHLIFYLGALLFYSLDRVVHWFVPWWGGDLCLVVRKENG